MELLTHQNQIQAGADDLSFRSILGDIINLGGGAYNKSATYIELLAHQARPSPVLSITLSALQTKANCQGPHRFVVYTQSHNCTQPSSHQLVIVLRGLAHSLRQVFIVKIVEQDVL